MDISDKNEIAIEMLRIPEFWCRAKLATGLAAAYRKGVLKELLDEWGVAAYAQRRIMESIRAHWLDKVAEIE